MSVVCALNGQGRKQAGQAYANELKNRPHENDIDRRNVPARCQVPRHGGRYGRQEEQWQKSNSGFLGRISVNGLQTLRDVDDDSCEGEADEERGTVSQKARESKWVISQSV